MKSFIVRWYADCYIGSFNYFVVADDIEKAKKLWEKFVSENNNNEIGYSWEKAKRAMENHRGGYIKWKENGDVSKEQGCYELEYDPWHTGSDHLWD